MLFVMAAGSCSLPTAVPGVWCNSRCCGLAASHPTFRKQQPLRHGYISLRFQETSLFSKPCH